LARPDEVFPTLVRDLLPVGLRGLVIAAVMAAIMSTIDSTLNAASAIAVYDLAGLQRREISPRRLLAIARLTTLGFMIVAILWAPVIERFPGLFSYLQEVFSYAVPPVAAIYLGGIFWRGAQPGAALWALVVGHAAGLALFIATQAGMWPLHFTINAFILTVVSFATLVVVSRLSAEQVEPPPETRWTPDMAAVTPGTGILQDYRLWSALVLVAVAASVIFFF
jgi:SSS family solute:Na+ symporter